MYYADQRSLTHLSFGTRHHWKRYLSFTCEIRSASGITRRMANTHTNLANWQIDTIGTEVEPVLEYSQYLLWLRGTPFNSSFSSNPPTIIESDDTTHAVARYTNVRYGGTLVGTGVCEIEITYSNPNWAEHVYARALADYLNDDLFYAVPESALNHSGIGVNFAPAGQGNPGDWDWLGTRIGVNRLEWNFSPSKRICTRDTLTIPDGTATDSNCVPFGNRVSQVQLNPPASWAALPAALQYPDDTGWPYGGARNCGWARAFWQEGQTGYPTCCNPAP